MLKARDQDVKKKCYSTESIALTPSNLRTNPNLIIYRFCKFGCA